MPAWTMSGSRPSSCRTRLVRRLPQPPVPRWSWASWPTILAQTVIASWFGCGSAMASATCGAATSIPSSAPRVRASGTAAAPLSPGTPHQVKPPVAGRLLGTVRCRPPAGRPWPRVPPRPAWPAGPCPAAVTWRSNFSTDACGPRGSGPQAARLPAGIRDLAHDARQRSAVRGRPRRKPLWPRRDRRVAPVLPATVRQGDGRARRPARPTGPCGPFLRDVWRRHNDLHRLPRCRRLVADGRRRHPRRIPAVVPGRAGGGGRLRPGAGGGVRPAPVRPADGAALAPPGKPRRRGDRQPGTIPVSPATIRVPARPHPGPAWSELTGRPRAPAQVRR